MAAADLPNNAALHGAHHNLVERGRDPSLSFLHFTRQRDQLQSRFLCDARRTTTALPLPDPLPTLPCDALAPQAHRLHGHAQFLRNHRIRVWRRPVGHRIVARTRKPVDNARLSGSRSSNEGAGTEQYSTSNESKESSLSATRRHTSV